MRSMNVEDGGCFGLFATVTGHQPDSTQAGSFQASLRVAIGERIHVQVFHHARRLWLKK
jgi:hypothetical protein